MVLTETNEPIRVSDTLPKVDDFDTSGPGRMLAVVSENAVYQPQAV